MTGGRLHLGGGVSRSAAFSLGGRVAAALTPTQTLVQSLLAYSPSLVLLGDVGTLQGNGTAAVAGDPLTAAVAIWQDQSGNGNDATQTTVMSQPHLTADAINGRTALTFDGMDDWLLDPFNASWAAAPNLDLLFVLQDSAPSPFTFQMLYGNDGGGFGRFFNCSAYDGSASTGSGVAPILGGILSGWTCLLVQLRNAQSGVSSVRVNGTTQFVFSENHQSSGTPNNQFALGCLSPGNIQYFFPGNIAAAIISTGDLTSAQAPVAAYYGITLSA